MLDRQKNPIILLWDFMRSFQDFTFSTRIQDGIPRDSQRDKKGKCLTDRKTLARFYQILWHPFRTSLFPPGSRMGSQGVAKGTKKEHVWQVENLSKFLFDFIESFQDFIFSTRIQDGIPRGNQRDQTGKCLTSRNNPSKFLLYFMRSFQDLTFSTRIQDGIPRDNQRDQKGKCLTGSKTLSISLWDFMRSLQDLTFPPRIQGGIQRDNQTGKKGKCLTDRKTLASFYQILWDPFMAQLFSPGSRMASQGTTKGTKKEHVWQVEKPQQVFIWFYEVLSRLHFSHQDPGWDPKGQPKKPNRKILDE